MVLEEKTLNSVLRATLWAALKGHGFRTRTQRVAWRYAGDDTEATGCPPLSLSTVVACYPRFVPMDATVPERNGRPQPRYWHCEPFRVFLDKSLSQPWFQKRMDRGVA